MLKKKNKKAYRKKVLIIMDKENTIAITEILSKCYHGSISEAVREALILMFSPANLAKKEMDRITRNFLPDDIKERIISGETLGNIADDLMRGGSRSENIGRRGDNEDTLPAKKEDVPIAKSEKSITTKASLPNKTEKTSESRTTRNEKKTKQKKKSADMSGGAFGDTEY